MPKYKILCDATLNVSYMAEFTLEIEADNPKEAAAKIKSMMDKYEREEFQRRGPGELEKLLKEQDVGFDPEDVTMYDNYDCPDLDSISLDYRFYKQPEEVKE